MISVVIPLYNKESNIIATLNAVINQSYKQFEIVIVDDGSTDNSLELVQAVNDERLRVFTQRNQGVSVARNKGILEAQTSWIALLDADDVWDKDYLRELTLAMSIYPEKNIFASGHTRKFKAYSLRHTNKFLPEESKIGVVDYIDALSAGQGPINSSNSIIKKDVLIESGMFKPGQKNYEDHDVWLRIYREDDIVFVNKNLVVINRDIPDSASSHVFKALDLLKYLDSMIITRKKLSGSRADKFEQFYNKWCLFTFLKYGKFYSRVERKTINLKMANLLAVKNALAIKMISFFNLSKPFGYLNNWRKATFK